MISGVEPAGYVTTTRTGLIGYAMHQRRNRHEEAQAEAS